MIKTEKCVIFTGGAPIYCRGFDKSDFEGCLIIAADSGIVQLERLNHEGFGLSPDILLGDMDSFDKETALKSYPKAEFLSFPPRKDYTDTQLALDVAKSKGFENIDIIGGTGNRADHYLANLALIRKCTLEGIKLSICDGKNKITYCNDGKVSAEKNIRFKYFSILPDTENLYGVTISGAKYPLDNAAVDRDLPVSVSNEITGDKCDIEVERGSFFFILSSD